MSERLSIGIWINNHFNYAWKWNNIYSSKNYLY